MLALDHISKSYGPRRVLDDVTWHVERGELLGYVGGNGAGKTTSMRITLGVATADTGTVTLDGQPVDDAVRARMGYMPEERGLYATMQLHAQLRFFAELRGVERRAAARSADAWLDRLGLAERRHHRLEDLSLGNQQRVQLAAALVHSPDVLVLDEPFSGLDPLAVDVMAQILREEADRGVPVVFSSHQLDLVERICDRVAVLAGGRVVAVGSVAELTGDEGDRHLVRADGAPGWLAELAQRAPALHATVRPQGDPGDPAGAVTLRAAEDALPLVVDVVRRHGVLRELRPWRPSLTDVYRDVVGATVDPADQTDQTDDHRNREERAA
ncbi:ABC transporter ATP-binding protein [Nocardioides nanhaiensis]|uniref:ATP-binding cassette domain-containing protein n=1 Tax=Nocardioides nanhaiensis TaxID=1476871 RepID=A0ABP8VRZ3_9ACTN